MAHPLYDPRPPAPCDVGIITALGMESGYFEDRLTGKTTLRGAEIVVREGSFAGRRVTVMNSGPGLAAAARATEALIFGHRPRWIIAAGFAGGLNPQLRLADIVFATSIRGERNEELTLDGRIDTSELPHWHSGRILSVDRIIFSPQEKLRLGETYDALSVDMESLAVAETCRSHRLPLVVVRSISDTASQQLPADVQRLLNQSTLAKRIGSAAGSMFRRPSVAKDLWRLREQAINASVQLADALGLLIKQLVPPAQHDAAPPPANE